MRSLFLLLLVTGAMTRSDPISGPFWVLGSSSPVAGETSDAWLILPALPGNPAVPARVELLAPSSLEVWRRNEEETCQSARRRKSKTWEGRLVADEILSICLSASRSQKLRLIARVRFPPGVPPLLRVAVSETFAVQPRYHFGELSIAVISAILGFLTGTLTHLLEKRWETQGALIRMDRDMELVIARKLAAEVLDNYHRLRSFLSHPDKPPDSLHTEGSDLLFDESRGVLTYLRDPRQLAFLKKFRRLYDLFNGINQAVNREERDQARRLAEQALVLLDRSLYEFTGSPPSREGGTP